MTRSLRTTMWLAAVVWLAGVTVAAAQPGPGRGARDGAGWTRLAERLDLTEEQKQAIGAIREEGRARQLETRKRIVQLESQLHAMMLADTPDEAAALKLVTEIGDLRAEQQAGRVKMRLAIRKQLTPAQRTQFILMEGRLGRGHRAQRGGMDTDADDGRTGRRGPWSGRGIN